MFRLLERWASLEPQWCRLEHDRISFGPKKDDDWIEWDWEFVPWRETGSLLMAVMKAIATRGWTWQRHPDGTVTVGHPNALHSIVIGGESFAADLLNAYVQRLEMETYLLANDEALS